jgi:hypothetical protein
MKKLWENVYLNYATKCHVNCRKQNEVVQVIRLDKFQMILIFWYLVEINGFLLDQKFPKMMLTKRYKRKA